MINHKPIIKLLTAATLAMLVAIAVTSAALAHANLLRSEPADRAVLATAPRQVRLWFSEAVATELSSVRVLDINGHAVETSGLRADPAQEGLVVVDLADLAPGLYSVVFQVLSEDDGHLTRGQIVFGVGNQVNAGLMSSSASTASAALPVEVFLRGLSLGLLAALIGAVTIARFVLVPTEQMRDVQAAIGAARRRVLGWAVWCSGLAWLVGLGILLWQAVAVTGALGGTWQLLRTRWGVLWLMRQLILLALIAGTFSLYRMRSRNDRPIWLITGLLCLARALTESLNSHAAALLSNSALAVGADMLHVLAASLWVGGLLALIVGLLPQIARDRQNLDSIVRAGWGPSASTSVTLTDTLPTGVSFITSDIGGGTCAYDSVVTTHCPVWAPVQVYP